MTVPVQKMSAACEVDEDEEPVLALGSGTTSMRGGFFSKTSFVPSRMASAAEFFAEPSVTRRKDSLLERGAALLALGALEEAREALAAGPKKNTLILFDLDKALALRFSVLLQKNNPQLAATVLNENELNFGSQQWFAVVLIESVGSERIEQIRELCALHGANFVLNVVHGINGHLFVDSRTGAIDSLVPVLSGEWVNTLSSAQSALHLCYTDALRSADECQLVRRLRDAIEEHLWLREDFCLAYYRCFADRLSVLMDFSAKLVASVLQRMDEVKEAYWEHYDVMRMTKPVDEVKDKHVVTKSTSLIYKPEPFKIKMVEPIRLISRAKRLAALKAAGYNLFFIAAKDVYIDLLTDSGTAAMSHFQWAAMLSADEAYAGSRSYFRLKSAVTDIFGFDYFVPTHQGRAAESILASLLVESGKYIPSNSHFDTTEGNIRGAGGIPVNLVRKEAYEPSLSIKFKGDMDIPALKDFITTKGAANIPFGMICITNNAGGGQPVSMANLRAVSRVYKTYGIPFFIDACRFAENAYFVKKWESGYADKSPLQIAREMFALADGCTMSAKKDGMANIGGFLAVNDKCMFDAIRNELIMHEGFVTYGGLAGRDLDAVAVGLREALDEDYLEYRVRQAQYLGKRLLAAGIPIVEPPGAHAIYVDALSLLPHLPQTCLPAQALAAALYLEGGIRGVELGTVAFGYVDQSGQHIMPKLDVVRLALPRRVYTQSHIDYVVDVFAKIYRDRHKITGLRITYQPKFLRHFTAQFEVIDAKEKKSTV